MPLGTAFACNDCMAYCPILLRRVLKRVNLSCNAFTDHWEAIFLEYLGFRFPWGNPDNPKFFMYALDTRILQC